MRYHEKRMAELNAITRHQIEIARMENLFVPPPLAPQNASRRKYAPGSISKTCTKCRVVKLLDDFSAHPLGALGRNPMCKECIKARGKEQTKNRREKAAGRLRPDACDCCKQIKTLRRALHWDHDHTTGQFRGWLCHHCNLALGSAQDSVERLQQLIAYLKRGGGPA